MAIREVRMCDTVGCFKTYWKTCTVCDQDRCEDHFGGGQAKVSVSVGQVIGQVSIELCKSCRTPFETMGSNSCHAFDDDLAKIPLLERIRGILTASALAEPKK